MEIEHVFTIDVDTKEFNAIQLACALMLENDLTHQYWVDILRPMVDMMNEVLGLDEEY